MAINYLRNEISDGVFFTSITDERFKTNYISVNIITELSAETAAVNAIIPSILTKCCNKYKSISELNKKLTSLYGAGLNGDVFKNADNQGISISASCIADRYTFNKESILIGVIDLLLECLMHPYIEGNAFAEKNFLLCRQELIDEIVADINDKRSYALIRAGKTIYKGEPCEITSHGDKENAEKITAQSAYSEYQKLLKTSRIEIIFSGAEIKDTEIEKIKNAFKNIQRNYNGRNIKSKFSVVKDKPCEAIEKLDVAQCKMVMAFKSDNTNIPAVNLMNAVFGGTPFSKLFLNVREKYSLCYYCSAGFNDNKGVIIVDSGVEKENIQKAKDEILNQLTEMTKGNFDDEEIKNSSLSIINRLKSVNDSPYALTSWYLKQVFSGTNYSPEQEIERIKAVTKQEIVDVAKSFKLDTVYVLTSKGE